MVVAVAVVKTIRTLGSFEVENQYRRVSRLGDRLDELSATINWNAFRNTLEKTCPPSSGPGRPAYDRVQLFKMLVLQSWYGLSDEQLEYQTADRFSFQKFLGFPETIPDYSTIWQFREQLVKLELFNVLLSALNKQLDARGLKVRKGVIQDASVITADPGKKRIAELKNKSEEGKGVSYTPNQLSHIDLDASSTAKNGQYVFGYKAHVKCDAEFQLIRAVVTTTASVHDSQVSLEEDGDGPVYRDRAYAGIPLNASGVVDCTMHKAYRGRPVTPRQVRQNTQFSKTRCLGERPFAVIKRVFHGSHVFVKTNERAGLVIGLRCFGYNIYRAFGLSRKNS